MTSEVGVQDLAGDLISTREAADLLGVKPATLYAYVSRGLLRSHRASGNAPSTFRRSAVEELARSRGRRPALLGLAGTQPEVSVIVEDTLYYRGEDACRLARTRRFEDVAEWLWSGERRATPAWRANAEALRLARPVQQGLPATTPPVDRLAVVVPLLAATDPLRLDLSPRAVALTARTLIATLVEALPEAGPPAHGRSVAHRLWARLAPDAPTDADIAALDAALILVADHGTRPPATATARLAASLRSDPYAVVSAAMGVGSGAQQARRFLTLQAIFAGIAEPIDAIRVLGGRLRQGEDVPGFQRRQYGGADPRARLLLAMLAEQQRSPGRLAGIQQLVDLIRERRAAEPNVEVAVAALAAVAGMIPGAGEAIFGIGRTAGWIAHALQVYTQAPRTDVPTLLHA